MERTRIPNTPTPTATHKAVKDNVGLMSIVAINARSTAWQ